jgi:hypothetical protein
MAKRIIRAKKSSRKKTRSSSHRSRRKKKARGKKTERRSKASGTGRSGAKGKGISRKKRVYYVHGGTPVPRIRDTVPPPDPPDEK